MTAVQQVKFESRTDRQAREQAQWVEDAVAYMMEIGLYAQEELADAVELADNLRYHNKDEGGEMMNTPKEAIDEELTYWGE